MTLSLKGIGNINLVSRIFALLKTLGFFDNIRRLDVMDLTVKYATVRTVSWEFVDNGSMRAQVYHVTITFDKSAGQDTLKYDRDVMLWGDPETVKRQLDLLLEADSRR